MYMPPRSEREGAAKGDPEAQFALGVMHLQGEGRPIDYVEARWLFGLAAAQGHGGAQHNLGIMNLNGLSGPIDYAEAHRLFTLAAAQGEAEARSALDNIRGVREQRVGVRAVVSGTSRADLNGVEGTITGYVLAKDRYRFAPDDGRAALLCKPEHLEPLDLEVCFHLGLPSRGFGRRVPLTGRAAALAEAAAGRAHDERGTVLRWGQRDLSQRQQGGARAAGRGGGAGDA